MRAAVSVRDVISSETAQEFVKYSLALAAALRSHRRRIGVTARTEFRKTTRCGSRPEMMQAAASIPGVLALAKVIGPLVEPAAGQWQ